MSKTDNASGRAICLMCGAEFKTFPSYIRDGRAKYCNKECGYRALRRYPEGKKKCTLCKKILDATTDYFYTSKSKFDKLHTECIECVGLLNYKRTAGARKMFVESRGSKCVGCGVTHTDHSFFDIDHINPLYKLEQKRAQYDYSDSENLQLLCPNCHRLKTLRDRGWR